jgi:Fe-S oxidoreductase
MDATPAPDSNSASAAGAPVCAACAPAFQVKALELLPSGGNYTMCLTCGLCSSGCPASGLEGMDPRKFVRMAALGMNEELAATPWVWMCTMCKRCQHVCPMNIDIPRLVFHARSCWPRDKRPRGIVASCEQALRTGTHSAMGIGPDDFAFVVQDVLEELHESQPQFAGLTASLNRKGAHFFLNQNSREPVTEPDEMLPLWKILDYVGADWTYGTSSWAAENFCMFAADEAAWESIVRDLARNVHDLGCKVWLNTECGHAYYAVWEGMRRFGIQADFRLENLVTWYARWIREGKLPVNSDWNRELGITFTVQDPCQIVRKSLGDDIAEDLRFVIKAVVGEEHFIEMYPNRSNNYCCGGGGGALQGGYPEQRRAYGLRKRDQILATGAKYCITPCHNCHSQIHDLSGQAGHAWETVHLWTLICLSLGILGENERAYLGPDLAGVGL